MTAQDGEDEEDTSLLQTSGTSDTIAEKRFRAVPTFLTDDPCWSTSHKIDGTHDHRLLQEIRTLKLTRIGLSGASLNCMPICSRCMRHLLVQCSCR